MVNFNKIDKQADEKKAEEKANAGNFPAFTSVAPGTARLFKIVDIRVNTMKNKKPGEEEIIDVQDLIEDEKYSLNMPTVLRRIMTGHDKEGNRNADIGTYVYIKCPAEKTPSQTPGKGDYWDFTVSFPDEKDVMDALKEENLPAVKKSGSPARSKK